ncbi:hypothetical protein KC315_g5944 [Hortaea werneckii]|nr:hypothetical protein KC315_g5944 [Hortaea werneckii]
MNGELRLKLWRAEAANRGLQESNSDLRDAEAKQKAHAETLEHENRNLRVIAVDWRRKSERIEALERESNDLKRFKFSCESAHLSKIDTLEHENRNLRGTMTDWERKSEQIKALQRESDDLKRFKFSCESAHLGKIDILEHENRNLRETVMDWERKSEQIKALACESDHPKEPKYSFEVSNPSKINTLERKLFDLRCENSTLKDERVKLDGRLRESAESRLHTLLSAERATSQEALNEVKECKELLECSKTHCLALEEAAQAREICMLRERQYTLMCWWEQATSVREEHEYELAWSIHICAQHEKDAKDSRRKIAVEQEESAITRLKLKDYQQWNRDLCDDLKQAKKECLEQRGYHRQYVATTNNFERERNKLRTELANLEHDHQSLQDYSRKLEMDLKTSSSTTREVLEEKTELLRAAEGEKATCDKIIQHLTTKAKDREIHVSQPEVPLANPTSLRVTPASATPPQTGKPTESRSQYSVDDNKSQPKSRKISPSPSPRQASPDELGHDQPSQDLHRPQKRPCVSARNGSTNNCPSWNAQKRKRFI